MLACELVVYSGVIFLKSFIILCWMNVHQYFVETFCLRKGLDEYFGAPINCSLFPLLDYILCFPYRLLVRRLNVRLFRLSLLFTLFSLEFEMNQCILRSENRRSCAVDVILNDCCCLIVRCPLRPSFSLVLILYILAYELTFLICWLNHYR